MNESINFHNEPLFDDFKNTILDTIVKPYQIFYKDEIKIGIFGASKS